MSTATTQRKTENVKEIERVRGPKLALLSTKYAKYRFKKAFERVDEKNRVFPSNKVLDKALSESRTRRTGSRFVFPCWSGTMTGYKEPGEKLGDYVIRSSGGRQKCIFPVNKKYRKEKDAILIVEHPDYDLKPCEKEVIERVQDIYKILLPKKLNPKTNSIVVVQDIKNVDLIENFPSEEAWYLTDKKHGIPIGNKVDDYDSNADARYLWRSDSKVGLIVRGFDIYYGYNGDWRVVGLLAEFPPKNWVVVEEIAVPKQLTVKEESSKIIVEGGTPEQITAAAKLLFANISKIHEKIYSKIKYV